jgi:hypothetical protein
VDVVSGQLQLAITPSAPGLPRKQFRRAVLVANLLSYYVHRPCVGRDNEIALIYITKIDRSRVVEAVLSKANA